MLAPYDLLEKVLVGEMLEQGNDVRKGIMEGKHIGWLCGIRDIMDETTKSEKSWWKTFPGVLTAISGIIIAVTGLIGALHQAGLLGDSERPSPVEPAQEPLALAKDRSASAESLAADPCELLADHQVDLMANNFTGVMASGIGLLLQPSPNEGYKFETTVRFTNEPVDRVIGSCRGGNIRFTRERPGDFTQVYVGEIVKGQRMEGTFSHNGKGAYAWIGTMKAGKSLE